MSPSSVLVAVLRDPGSAKSLDLEQWDDLLRQARCASLLGKLGVLLSTALGDDEIPKPVRRATRSAAIIAQKIRRDVQLELYVLGEIFKQHDERIVLLKGTAYIAGELKAADARIFGDIDILVKKTRLDQVEQCLKDAGWSFGPIDSYDEGYYRRWTHELPPMEHQLRGTLIDVHHAILQERHQAPTARSRMLADAVIIDERFAVLKPVDMVLHASAHLFNDGEFDKGLRDLLDIVSLVQEFVENDPAFWDELVERASLMHLAGPLYMALDHGNALFGLDVPESVFRDLKPAGDGGRMLRAIMHRALLPHHKSCADWLTGFSLKFLYIRGHYLRMPLVNLLIHLTRKALKSEPAPQNHVPQGGPLVPERG